MRKRALTAVLSVVILAVGGLGTAWAVSGDVEIPVPAEVFTSADGREITVPARTITSNVTLPDPPPVTVTVTETVTVPGGGGGAPSYESMVALHFPSPSFTPARVVDVASKAQFDTAITNLQPGDQINAHDFNFPSWYKLQNKNLADWAEVRFTNVNFAAGVELQNISKIRFYGGDITAPWTGLRIFDSVDVTWRNFYIHDTSGTGLMVTPTSSGTPGYKSPERIELVGEITNCGLDLTQDPHTETGTGLHGAYIGKHGALPVKSIRLALDIHDQPSGAAVQQTNTQGGLMVLRAERITRNSNSMVAGNAWQLFGAVVTDFAVKYLEASDLQGNAVDVTNWAAAGSLSTNTVEYGRATNYGLNADLNGAEAWDTQGGIVYEDVQPEDFGAN